MTNPTYVQGSDIYNTLVKFYSKAQIERLEKQGGIKIAEHEGDTWIKLGKQIIILSPNPITQAINAQVWWEYHFQLMPRALKWTTPNLTSHQKSQS
jgi:hypothetical protein